MTRSTSGANSAIIPADATLCTPDDKRAMKALQNLRKYDHADHTHLWRASDGKHLIAVIRCQQPGCKGERSCFTSDVFQTKKCLGSHGEEGNKAPAKKAKKDGVRSKGGTKGGRKAPKGRKAAPRVRKAKRTPASTTAAPSTDAQ